MPQRMVTLRNNFHKTYVNLFVDSAALAQGGADLTPSQIRRVRRELCLPECSCAGNDLLTRGPQDVEIDHGQDREAHPTATLWEK